MTLIIHKQIIPKWLSNPIWNYFDNPVFQNSFFHFSLSLSLSLFCFWFQFLDVLVKGKSPCPKVSWLPDKARSMIKRTRAAQDRNKTKTLGFVLILDIWSHKLCKNTFITIIAFSQRNNEIIGKGVSHSSVLWTGAMYKITAVYIPGKCSNGSPSPIKWTRILSIWILPGAKWV